MDSEGVSLPFHKHLMMPWNDLSKGYCCGRLEAISDGYYCKICDFFVHKKCGDETSDYIEHPSHPGHTLKLNLANWECELCGKFVKSYCYQCAKEYSLCHFQIDLLCARNPPPKVLDISEIHRHKLTLFKKSIEFVCDAKCGKIFKSFPYRCYKCDSFFHVDCVWHTSKVKHPLELNHSHHPLHPLKLLMGSLPEYSDGKCRLCGRKIKEWLYYHCSSCNFSLDMRCVLNPPPQSLVDFKTHDHKLTLLPRLLYFTCNVCGLNGDRSPYVCIECDFMIHGDCVGLPRLININRHDHRIARTSLLGIVNSKCEVCHKKVDWTCGGYSCQKCPEYIVHSKCATREDVWNGKELEGVPEETEDIVNPYVVINDNTIQHFSHIEHHLRLHVNGVLCEVENKRCNACCYPVCLQSFYGCIDCDYILHQTCAEFPRKKQHVLHNEWLTLVTSEAQDKDCYACDRWFNGFRYEHGDKTICLLCASISQPFFHPSHPQHLLYYILQENPLYCDNCEDFPYHVLKCIENDCEFTLDFKCATLPLKVKHRVDDHPLLLCFGEKASGKYWCDICEKESNPEIWFYTCKDYQASLHIECVIGHFFGLMPTSTIKVFGRSWEVVLNKSVTRPFCSDCKSRCMYPIMLKTLGRYFCNIECMFNISQETIDQKSM